MNNKLTFLGGEPNMTEDDFLRIQQANRLGLFGMGGVFNNGNPLIISGCITSPNGSNIDITPGYIFLGGELLRVDAQINVDDTEGNGFYRYEKQVTFDAGGDKTYLDSTPRQTWEINRGIAVSVVSIGGGDLDVKNGKRFDELIQDIIDINWLIKSRELNGKSGVHLFILFKHHPLVKKTTTAAFVQPIIFLWAIMNIHQPADPTGTDAIV